ncbi:MAG: hypothetical protein ACKVHO_17520 [Verrucomicrobiia bacterium]
MTEATIKPLAVTVLLLTALGCTSIHESDYVNGPDYVPANVYEIQLPPEVRRVAILPLSSARRDQNHLEGVKISEPLLRRELSARQAFESRSVPAAWLKRHTGKSHWRADEPLPPELLSLLESRYGCDAVLFAHLTEYHPYPPIRMGWNLKLVQATNSAVLWSVDEIFDASRQEVVNSARRYYKGHEWGIRTVGNSRAILDSPRRFAMYTLHQMIRTLGKPEVSTTVSPANAEEVSSGSSSITKTSRLPAKE